VTITVGDQWRGCDQRTESWRFQPGNWKKPRPWLEKPRASTQRSWCLPRIESPLPDFVTRTVSPPLDSLVDMPGQCRSKSSAENETCAAPATGPAAGCFSAVGDTRGRKSDNKISRHV